MISPWSPVPGSPKPVLAKNSAKSVYENPPPWISELS